MPYDGIALPGLKAARLRKALTQEQLAAAAGVGRTTLARLETGSPAAPRTAQKLAAALGVAPDALMGPATHFGQEGSQGKAKAAQPVKHAPPSLPTPWVQHGAGASL